MSVLWHFNLSVVVVVVVVKVLLVVVASGDVDEGSSLADNDSGSSSIIIGGGATPAAGFGDNGGGNGDFGGESCISELFGMKITEAKLSSESTLVSDWRLLSFEESDPSSRECLRSGLSLAPPLLLPQELGGRLMSAGGVRGGAPINPDDI